MAIPPLNADGLLPAGTHECTLDEVRERFGSFQRTDRRPRLFGDLERYWRDLSRAEIAKYLIVNGSFVTSSDAPNDIDVLLVLKDDVDLCADDVPPFRLNARDRTYVLREYKLDFYFGFEGDDSATKMMDLWSRVKLDPARAKGILKVTL